MAAKLSKLAQTKLAAFCVALAKTHEVATAEKAFAVTEPRTVKLQDAVQASDSFLQGISFIPVEDISGDVFTLEIPDSLASTKDTSGGDERAVTVVSSPDGREFLCTQTNSDVGIPYSLVNVWARYKDFNKRLSAALNRRRALDRLLVGWYGMSRAANSNRTTNPKLQDVDKGWIYDLKTNATTQYLTEGAVEAGKIQIGATGDYKTVDALVSDIYRMIPEEHRTGDEVLLIGKGLLATRNTPLDNSKTTATEAAADVKTHISGFEPITPAHFPDNGLIITSAANLQVYYQDSSMRKSVEDYSKGDRVNEWQSINDCYRIGNLKAIAGIEADNVKLV